MSSLSLFSVSFEFSLLILKKASTACLPASIRATFTAASCSSSAFDFRFLVVLGLSFDWTLFDGAPFGVICSDWISFSVK